MSTLIQYSPELIEKLAKEGKDYPIDPLVLAILNGVKKIPRGDSHHGHGGHHGARGRGRGRMYGGPGGQGGPGGRGGGRHRGRGRANQKPVGPRKKLFEEPQAFSDERLISDIRTILGKLSSENAPTITTQLLKLQLDKPECIEETTRVLHEAAVNGIFIVDYYVNIFLHIGKTYPKVIPHLNRRILRQISEPQTFADESDSITETRQQKSERWQISNSLLFAELYKRGVYSDDLLAKVLRIFLKNTDSSTLEGQFPLKVLAKFLPPILPKIVYREQDSENALDIKDVHCKLHEISKDKTFPGLVRFPILTLVKKWETHSVQ